MDSFTRNFLEGKSIPGEWVLPSNMATQLGCRFSTLFGLVCKHCGYDPHEPEQESSCSPEHAAIGTVASLVQFFEGGGKKAATSEQAGLTKGTVLHSCIVTSPSTCTSATIWSSTDVRCSTVSEPFTATEDPSNTSQESESLPDSRIKKLSAKLRISARKTNAAVRGGVARVRVSLNRAGRITQKMRDLGRNLASNGEGINTTVSQPAENPHVMHNLICARQDYRRRRGVSTGVWPQTTFRTEHMPDDEEFPFRVYVKTTVGTSEVNNVIDIPCAVATRRS